MKRTTGSSGYNAPLLIVISKKSTVTVSAQHFVIFLFPDFIVTCPFVKNWFAVRRPTDRISGAPETKEKKSMKFILYRIFFCKKRRVDDIVRKLIHSIEIKLILRLSFTANALSIFIQNWEIR